MTNQRWQVWLSALIGHWAFLSPWIFANAASTLSAPLTSGAEWNLWIISAAVIILSVIAVIAYQAWEEWVAALLGLWLVASPWIFSFSDATTMMWSVVGSGAVILVLAAWTAMSKSWRAATRLTKTSMIGRAEPQETAAGSLPPVSANRRQAGRWQTTTVRPLTK